MSSSAMLLANEARSMLVKIDWVQPRSGCAKPMAHYLRCKAVTWLRVCRADSAKQTSASGHGHIGGTVEEAYPERPGHGYCNDEETAEVYLGGRHLLYCSHQRGSDCLPEGWRMGCTASFLYALPQLAGRLQEICRIGAARCTCGHGDS